MMKVKVNKKTYYPSAELLLQPCMEDYKYQLESYNRIYNKVNIAMVLCSAVLLVILNNVNLSVIPDILQASTSVKFFILVIPFSISVGSGVLIFIATIQFLKLLTGREIPIFDSVYFRNNHYYLAEVEATAFQLIVAYTNATFELRTIVDEKQKVYDTAVKNMIIAVILLSVEILLQEMIGQ